MKLASTSSKRLPVTGESASALLSLLGTSMLGLLALGLGFKRYKSKHER